MNSDFTAIRPEAIDSLKLDVAASQQQQAQIDELLSERYKLTTEVERLRPVVELAKLWRAEVIADRLIGMTDRGGSPEEYNARCALMAAIGQCWHDEAATAGQ